MRSGRGGLTRREVLGWAALPALAALGGARVRAETVGRGVRVAAPRVAAQTYVFSQWYARRRMDYREHLGAIVREVAAAGYRNLELMSQATEAPFGERLRSLGEEHGVRFPVIYTGARLFDRASHRTALEQIRVLAERARALGAEAINCNPDPKPGKEAKSDGELAAEVEGIQALAELLGAEGLGLMLHQHDAEMRDGARNWRHWLRHTDAARVKFCFDAHWVLRGGQSPEALLRECLPRVASVHLRNSRAGLWMEDLDDGDLSYRPIAEMLRTAGYGGLLVVELALEAGMVLTRSPQENLLRSRAYVERRFL